MSAANTTPPAERPTPITDAEMRDYGFVRAHVSRDLERQLAERTEQRDRLAEALEIIGGGGADQFQWSMTKAEETARKALAAVKGGNDE